MNAAQHTPGPWVLDDRMLTPMRQDQSEIVTVIADFSPESMGCMVRRDCDIEKMQAEVAANYRLMAQSPLLFDFVKKMHRHLLAERDCFYEGCSDSDGNIPREDDRASLAAIEADIAEAQALIQAVEGDA